jgi:hypothetical protein
LAQQASLQLLPKLLELVLQEPLQAKLLLRVV